MLVTLPPLPESYNSLDMSCTETRMVSSLYFYYLCLKHLIVEA